MLCVVAQVFYMFSKNLGSLSVVGYLCPPVSWLFAFFPEPIILVLGWICFLCNVIRMYLFFCIYFLPFSVLVNVNGEEKDSR